MDTRVSTNTFTISDWLVEPATNRIRRGDVVIKLQPKAMDVLVYLAMQPGRVISRKELEESVWNGLVVGYDALTNTVIKLRRAFDDDSHNATIIETIPKGGYRLIAPVGEVPQGDLSEGEFEVTISSRARILPKNRVPALLVSVLVIVLGASAGLHVWQQSRQADNNQSMSEKQVSPSLDKPSIAVLPFTNMSDEAQQEYFVDGMTDDLITDLSKLSGMSVIARNSVFNYKGKSVEVRQVAKELGVRYVLEGSVRRAGDLIRVNAQLIDASTGSHLWAERYDGALTNVFKLQDEITQNIVAALAVNLTGVEKENKRNGETDNPQAYDAYLRGWAHYLRQTPRDFSEANDYFKRAIELDPNYSRVYAALATLYWETHLRQWHPALNIDVHKVKERAYAYRDQAMTNPTPLALVVASDMLIWRGQHDEAITRTKRAIELAPSDAHAQLKLAEILVYAGQPQDALEFIVKAARLDPYGMPRQLYIQGLAEFGLKLFDNAAASMKRTLKLNPDFVKPVAILAATYGHLGQQHAASILEPYKNFHWGRSLQSVVLAFPYQQEEDRKRLEKGLQRAGMREVY